MKLLLFITAILSWLPIYSQDINNKKVSLGLFSSYKSKEESKIESKIYEVLDEELKNKNFQTTKISGNEWKDRLENSKKNGSSILIEGFYKRSENGALNVYGQIYNVETGKLIDAFNRSFEFAEVSELKLDEKEMLVPDEKVIQEFSQKLVNRVRANPNRKENIENINEFVVNSQLGKDKNIAVPTEDLDKATEEVFKILNEENSISIVSKRIGVQESTGKTSAIVSVVNRRKIQDTGARNLADILKQIPGVEVFYDQMGFYKIAFRGIRAKSGVLLLLDGQRINNFYDGSTFLDLRADAIEKVEIIRGPGSSVHGTNAFVGVINVVTRTSFDGKSSGQVSTRIGSENTLEPSVFYGMRLGENWKISGYAERYETKGRKTQIANDTTCTEDSWSKLQCNQTAIPLPLNNSITTNDTKIQTNGFLNIDRNDNFFAKLKAIQEKRGPHVGEIGQVTPDSELGFKLLLGSIGFQNIELTKKISLSTKLYGDIYDRKDDIQVSRRDNLRHLGFSARKMNSYIYETHGIESILQLTLLKNLVFLLGVNYERLILRDFEIKKNYLRADTNTLLPAFFDFDNSPKSQNKDRHIKAVFGQTIYDPFSWLSITLGLRYDEYSDFGKTINPKTSAVITPFENTAYGTLAFKFLYGSAFRAPTFQELYDQTQAFQPAGAFGNRNLKPETIQTGEIGMEYNTPYKPLSFLVNGFYNSIRNNIAAINNSGTFPSERDNYQNLRGIKVGGIEFEVKLNYSNRNYFFANASWFQSQDNGGLPPNEKEDYITFLLDVPQARANLGANFEITKYFTLNNTVWISSERKSNSRFAFETQTDRQFKIPQYAVWNLSFASTEDLWSKGILRLSIFNMMNYKNFDDANYAIPSFPNRAIPSIFQYERYLELKLTYNL
ncbi:MAG: TonB-dependent receptor [Leptospiraceae bacterium]|nr:TonB-dependent receptor [Leptospiraceae bacterium]